MSANELLAELVAILTQVYAPALPNAERQRAIQALEHVCQQTDPNLLAAAAVQLLGQNDAPPPARAYGAVIVTRLVQAGAIGPEQAHAEEIAAWLCDASTQENIYGDVVAGGTGLRAPIVDRSIVAATSTLVAACAVRSWPATGGPMLPHMMSGDGEAALARCPSRQRLLLEWCRVCCMPSFATLKAQRIRELHGAVAAVAPQILAAAVSCLSSQYAFVMFLAQRADLVRVLSAVVEDMVVVLEVVALVAPCVQPPLQGMWTAGVDEASAALMACNGPCVAAACPLLERVKGAAVDAVGSVLGALTLAGVKDEVQRDAASAQRLQRFCEGVLSVVPTAVTTRNRGMLDRVVGLLSATSGLQSLVPALMPAAPAPWLPPVAVQAAAAIIQVPNIVNALACTTIIADHFGAVVQALADLKDPSLVSDAANVVDVRQLLTNLHMLSQKWCFNAWKAPVRCTSPHTAALQDEARMLACEQFGDQDAFISTYAQLRSSVATVFQCVAALHPQAAAELVQFLLESSLGPPAPDDSRAPSGNVQQQSEAFGRWEVAEFVVGSVLGNSIRSPMWSPADAARAFESIYAAMQARVSAGSKFHGDATLCPVYLNLWALVWHQIIPGEGDAKGSGPFAALLVTPPPPQVVLRQAVFQVAGAAVETMFDAALLCQGPHDARDLDVTSARKRGLTLLIAFCTHTLPALHRADPQSCAAVVDLIRGHVETALIRDAVRPSERSLLNEAMASLTLVVSDEDSKKILLLIVGDAVSTLQAVVGSMASAANFALMLCSDERAHRTSRDHLKDAVGTLTATMRRCAVSSSTTAMVQAVIPLLGDLALKIHSLSPRDFPPSFEGMLDPLDDSQRQQMATGTGNRRPHSNNQFDNARRGLSWLRMAVYQGIALSARFAQAEGLTAGIARMLVGSEHFPVQAMLDLCEQCLFDLTVPFPPLVRATIDAVAGFLQVQAHTTRDGTPEVVAARQLYFFCRGAVSYVRAALVEDRAFADVKRGPALEGPSLGAGAAALRLPTPAPFVCLGSPDAYALFETAMTSLLIYGHDPRGAALLALIVLCEAARRRVADANMGTIVTKLFALTLTGVMRNPWLDKPQTRTYLLALIADVYLAEFPTLSGAFTTAFDFVQQFAGSTDPSTPRLTLAQRTPGAATFDLDDMHAHLASARGQRQKREAFTDACFACFNMVRPQEK